MKTSHTIIRTEGDEVTIYIADFLDSELAYLLKSEYKYGFSDEDITLELIMRGRKDLIPEGKIRAALKLLKRKELNAQRLP